MRIGFDYIAVIGRGGNRRYSMNLLEALAKIDDKNEYYLYGYIHDFLRRQKHGRQLKKNFKIKPGYCSSLGLPIPPGFLMRLNETALRLAAKRDRLQAFHFTNPLHYVPKVPGSIVTVHDLAPLHNSAWAKKSTVAFFRDRMGRMLQDSFRIISVSNFTKQDIIERFHIDENKITVIPEAADAVFYRDRDWKYVKEKFHLEKYIFCAGQLQPRKNVRHLLSAYRLLHPALRAEYTLALAGEARDRVFLDRLNEDIEALDLGKSVVLLGRVSDEALRKLYSCAQLFVYPSLFEGFGLPILEALQCGTPVIAADAASLPEVVGTAGLLFHPYAVEELAGALFKMLTDDDCSALLRSRCAGQAEKFSWLAAAEKTLGVYGECAA